MRKCKKGHQLINKIKREEKREEKTDRDMGHGTKNRLKTNSEKDRASER